MAPRAESDRHSHPDYLVYALSDGKVRLTNAEHSALNIGDAALRALFIELK